MKNLIKEFFRKRKERKSQLKESNYGDISIQCIYHDNFIQIMDNIIALEKGTVRIKDSSIFSSESTVKTSVKGETLTLNYSDSIFKQSILCAINESMKAYHDRFGKVTADQNICVLNCSKIIIKIVIQIATQSAIDMYKILKDMFYYLDVEVKIQEEKNEITFIVSGSCLWFNLFKEALIENKLLEDNILAVKLVDYIKSIIPEYDTRDGNMYFTGLSGDVNYIEAYQPSKGKVHVLTHTNLDSINLKEYISKDNVVYKMHQIYLVIDNAGEISETFNICDIVYKVHNADRYLIRLSYDMACIFIEKLESLKLVDNVKNSMRDNIISTIRNIIPPKALNPDMYEDIYEDAEYANVDEIIED